MPRSATPSAMSPTISSLSRSSRSTLTCGLAVKSAAIGTEILAQPLSLAQNDARMRKKCAACLRGCHALPLADQQCRSQRLFHVANSRAGSGKREVCACGSARDASGFDHLPEEAEVDQIKV